MPQPKNLTPLGHRIDFEALITVDSAKIEFDFRQLSIKSEKPHNKAISDGWQFRDIVFF